jgi:hypothetical protein
VVRAPHPDHESLGQLLEEDNLRGELSSLQRDSLELEAERRASSSGLKTAATDLAAASLVVHNLIRRALDGRPPLTARVIRHLRLGLASSAAAAAGGGSRGNPIMALLQAQLMKVAGHTSLTVCYSYSF